MVEEQRAWVAKPPHNCNTEATKRFLRQIILGCIILQSVSCIDLDLEKIGDRIAKPSKTALCTIERKLARTTKAAFCRSRQHSRCGQTLKIIIDASQKMKRMGKLKQNPICYHKSRFTLRTEEDSENDNEILHQLRSGRDYESRIKEALSSAYLLAEHDILGKSKPFKKRRFRVPPINITKHKETKTENDTRGYASRQLTNNTVAIHIDDLLSMFPLGEMTQSGPETNDSREQITKSIKSKLSGHLWLHK